MDIQFGVDDYELADAIEQAFDSFIEKFCELTDMEVERDEGLVIWNGEGRRIEFTDGGSMVLEVNNVYLEGDDDEEYDEDEDGGDEY